MICCEGIINDSEAARRGVHLRQRMGVALDSVFCAEHSEKMDEEILYIQRAKECRRREIRFVYKSLRAGILRHWMFTL